MPAFRLYTIGSNGRLMNREDIECADDQEAIQKAQQAVVGDDIELSERYRFISRLSAKLGSMK